MALFPKDRNLAEAFDRVELEVRASDFRMRGEDLQLRLDRFLAHHLTWRSRSSIQQLIKDGQVLVAASRPDAAPPGHRSRAAHRPPPLLPPVDEPTVERRPGRRLLDRSLVVVRIPDELQLALDPGACGPVDLVHEDPAVLVVDKPAGVAVHPSGRHLTDTLVQRLHADHARRLEARAAAPGAGPEVGEMPPKLCHRLDRETSGLVLAARDRASHAALVLDFEERRVAKRYLAVVHGVPERTVGEVDLDLGPALASEVRLKIAVRAGGWPSRTGYEVIETGRLPDGGPCALVACVPHTGRQHQLRVHLAALGHPLVGDKLYRDEGLFLRAANDALTDGDRAELVLDRHALHNELLGFTHPRTGERLEVTAPLPADMAGLLGR